MFYIESEDFNLQVSGYDYTVDMIRPWKTDCRFLGPNVSKHVKLLSFHAEI